MDGFKLTSRNVIESIMVLLLFVALLVALYDVLKIFFGVLTFALIFSVSFSTPFERLTHWMHDRRKLAAIVYIAVLIAVIAIPVTLLVSALNAHVAEVVHWTDSLKANGLPALPTWVRSFPLVGTDIQTFWDHLQSNPKGIIQQHGPQAKSMLHTVLLSGAGVLSVSLQFIAGIVISAFFLSSRKQMLSPMKAATQHLFGERDGANLLDITEQAIKGVAIGVMGTAFLTAGIAWIGLAIAGIPFSIGISALIFFLVVIQVGPLPVWIPLTIWLFIEGHTGMAVFMIIYGIGVIIVENVSRPILIAKSGKIPFLVLFIGVIGGLSAWGFTGMFKGAIIVAICYTVFNSWLEKKNNHTATDKK